MEDTAYERPQPASTTHTLTITDRGRCSCGWASAEGISVVAASREWGLHLGEVKAAEALAAEQAATAAQPVDGAPVVP